MAAVLEARTGGGQRSTETIGAVVRMLLDALPSSLAGHSGAPADFLACKTLFVLLASADLAEVDLDEVAVRTTVARHCAVPPESRDPLKLSARNNHLLLRAVVLALLSLRGGDEEAGRASERLHRRYLSSIDESGVPVEEAVRGASAAWYCNLAVMLMTSYRWIAARSGRPVDGEERYLAAVAALARVADDPAILHPWSRRNLFPHPAHGHDPFAIDLGFLGGYHSSRHYLVWIALFLEMQPATALPAALTTRWSGAPDYFPRGNEFIGGFVDALI